MTRRGDVPHAETLTELLDLERIDRDLYRARNPDRPLAGPLFGGQVAAQALRAAGLTVPDNRLPHSLHGSYLRAGDAHHPTILEVMRDRDGRSFSARRVVARQHGEVIFSASTSFHVAEAGGEYGGIELPDEVPRPDALEHHAIHDSEFLLDLRTVEPPRREQRWFRNAAMWARTQEPLPDDPVLHASAISYLSDMSGGFAAVEQLDLPWGGSSLDHTVYFHRPARADRWLYLSLEPVTASGARGVYRGSVHDLDGRLVATLVQENLMRTESRA